MFHPVVLQLGQTVPLADLPGVTVTANRIRVNAGITATLLCIATGGVSAAYTYSWLYNGTLLPSETLPILTGVDVEGTYTCNIQNDAGDAMDSIFIYMGCEALYYNNYLVVDQWLFSFQ